MVTIDFKLADIKLDSSEAHLVKSEKICRRVPKSLTFFCKKAVLNICRYLKRFYTYKKMNNIFLKFHSSLLRMPKVMEIG